MKRNYLTLSLILSICFVSCTKENDSNPTPITKANISGSVNLYDESTTPIDKSGMSVKIVGSNPVISASTDVDGKFTFLAVPFGTYNLVYEKSGFGTFKKFDLKHTNTGSSTVITSTPSLGEVSTTQVTNLTASVNGSNVLLSITTNPAGSNANTRYVRYFLSADSGVNDENQTYYSPGLVSKINPVEVTIAQSDLINAGFSSGQTVYVKAYGDSFWSNEYDDLDLARRIFPNLNSTSANAVSFVVP